MTPSPAAHHEEELAASRDEMRSVLATIPDFVLRVGLDGIIKFINRTKPGVPMEQVVGSSISSWIHPEHREAVQALLEQVSETGLPGALETRGVGRNGASSWYLTRVGPVLESERVASLILVGEDISERKQSEEALRASAREIAGSAERFRSVIEASPVPYALNDDAQNITYLNPEFVRTFGYTLSDIPTLSDWWPRAYPDAAYREWVVTEWARRLDVARAGGAPYEPLELEIRAKDGSPRAVIASAASLGQANAGMHLVVLYDVTKAKKLEAERRKLEERLAQVQKMESIGRLAGGVAHDNNNMLSVILSHAEAALRDLDPSKQLYTDLMAIRQAAQRSANLTRQLLAHARRQPAAPKILDVGDTVAKTAALISPLIGEQISLTVRNGANVWPVKIDPTQIEQILTNLCVNARDAITGVGTIAISTENVVLTEGEATAHVGASSGDYVLITVKDDGSGMTPEVLAHAFEPFFSTKALGEGTGLGLATVYGIVQQNTGFILVDSSPGNGTVFKVYLPRHSGTVEKAAEDAPRNAPTERHETLLLVEDEAELLDIMASKLRQMGYTVLAAHGPTEALRVAREFAGRIALVVTDVIMPEMNGRELAARLEEQCPGLACLFASGYTGDVIAKQGVLDSGVHFLQKPFTPADLDAKIREILGKSAR